MTARITPPSILLPPPRFKKLDRFALKKIAKAKAIVKSRCPIELLYRGEMVHSVGRQHAQRIRSVPFFCTEYKHALCSIPI